MTNVNKINTAQKEVMAAFMQKHPNLARNRIPNCAQGKVTARNLWEELKRKLNSLGPPVKDAKTWKKVYADQKYQTKKKLSFNKESKQKTGGGPYEEMLITQADERLIEAAGLEPAVDGNMHVPTFGDNRRFASVAEEDDSSEVSSQKSVQILFNAILTDSNSNEGPTTSRPRKRIKISQRNEKLLLLQENLKATNEAKTGMDAKLDRLLQIQERLLEIKEEKHNRFQELSNVKLKIKKLELELLQAKKQL